MAIRFPETEGAVIEGEFAEIDLNDQRLDARMVAVAKLMAEHPKSSFSGMCLDEAEREALYRLLRNPRVESEDIIRPHIETTVRRCQDAGRILVAHDTTDIRIAKDADLDSYLTRGVAGFRAHMSMAIRGRDRAPLGICGLETIFRKKGPAKTKTKDGRRMRGNETAKLKNKEFDRWLRAVRETEERLIGSEVVHVMDREADSYPLLATMTSCGIDFVVRLAQKARRARLGSEMTSIEEALSKAKTFSRTREVCVGKRKAKRRPSDAKRYSDRAARRAQLTLSFARLSIARPKYLGDDLPESITLFVVRARENNPPPNATPIEWTLLTSLPVTTKAAVEDVIDVYRTRWLIEEYFRALKSGCSIEKRHLTNATSILNSLATFIPIAWRALWIRHRARANDQSPASTVFPEEQLAAIRAVFERPGKKKKLPSVLTIADAYALLAEAGGHRRRDGQPGWQSLLCGIEKFSKRPVGASLSAVFGM